MDGNATTIVFLPIEQANKYTGVRLE